MKKCIQLPADMLMRNHCNQNVAYYNETERKLQQEWKRRILDEPFVIEVV